MRKTTFPTAEHVWLRIVPILICMTWGGNVVAMRIAVAELPPIWTGVLRLAIASLLLAICGCLRPGYLRLSPGDAVHVAILSVLWTITIALLYLGLSKTAASHVAALLYLYPIFTACLAHFYLNDERISAVIAVGLAIGLLGAFVIIGRKPASSVDHSIAGAILATVSTAAWAASTVYIKSHLSMLHPLATLTYPTVASTAILLGAALVFEGPPPVRLSNSVLLAVVYQGVLATAMASIAWLTLVRRVRASVLSTYTFLTPAFGVIASVTMLKEPVSYTFLAGLSLVLLGLLLVEGGAARRTT